MICCLYLLRNTCTGSEYVGITRDFKQRMVTHKSRSRYAMPHLYRSIRKHGWDAFEKTVVCIGELDYVAELEKRWIKLYHPVYNVSSGGETGGAVPEFSREVWIQRLKTSRAGKQPAKGMKHTDENKELFSACSKKRWDKYGRYPKSVTSLSYKEAHSIYGISKTHYYRLRKLV